MRRAVSIFELPQKIGIPQFVECDTLCVLVAQGCRRGVCIRYRVYVTSRGRRWEPPRPPRRFNDDFRGLNAYVAEALVELSERGYDVGLAYEYKPYCSTCPFITREGVYVVINGVRLYQPLCRTAEDCVEALIEKYRHVVEFHAKKQFAQPSEMRLQELATRYSWAEILIKLYGHQKDLLIRLIEAAASTGRPEAVAEMIAELRPESLLEVALYAREGEVCVVTPNAALCHDGRRLYRNQALAGAVREARGLLAYYRYSKLF